MKLIAHRGNINGKTDKENNPDYLLLAIEQGYDVEVDVWYIDNRLFLGHDGPQYEVNIDFLLREEMWCHCKNIDALKHLLENDAHCFFHASDDVTLTSRNVIWTFPRKRLVEGSVCVLPELGYEGEISNCYGVCSDFIEEYK